MKIINRAIQTGLCCVVTLLMLCCLISNAAPTPKPTPKPASDPTLANAGWTIPNPVPTPTPLPDGSQPRPGAYGANRIVFHLRGDAAAKGTFLVPDFDMGTKFIADKHTTNDQGNPVFVAGKNPNMNKPTMYLGAQNDQFFFDSGLQYEALSKDGLDPGWSAVVNAKLFPKINGKTETDSKWYQSIDADSRPQLPVGQPVDMELFITTDGAYNLSIKTNGFSFPVEDADQDNPHTPNIYPRVTGPVNTSRIIARRVVGMTQASGFDTDGSYVRNGKFTGGMVKRWQPDGTVGDWENWSTGQDPGNPAKGHIYQPRDYNQGHEKDGPQDGPIFIVNSQAPWNRTPDTTGEDRPDSIYPSATVIHSRYYEETVDINLLSKPVGVQGKDKKLGKSR